MRWLRKAGTLSTIKQELAARPIVGNAGRESLLSAIPIPDEAGHDSFQDSFQYFSDSVFDDFH
jgi:hypothetical protein